jgi:hypothetical protein
LEATEPILDALTDALAMAEDNTTPADITRELNALARSADAERETIRRATAAIAATERAAHALRNRKIALELRASVLDDARIHKRPRPQP